jgi:anti-sigma regulatory factor (Ser/Thr protein kinase)
LEILGDEAASAMADAIWIIDGDNVTLVGQSGVTLTLDPNMDTDNADADSNTSTGTFEQASLAFAWSVFLEGNYFNFGNSDVPFAGDVINPTAPFASRITRGTITLQPEWVDLAALVASAVETSRPLIDARRQTLTVTLPSERLQVHADPARLAQVLSNLLNNAAKYTDEGGDIHVKLVREGGEAVVRVRDSGVGIPIEDQPYVFDKFYRSGNVTDNFEGTGLGLAISKEFIEAQGGKIWVHSRIGEGSEFGFSFGLQS